MFIKDEEGKKKASSLPGATVAQLNNVPPSVLSQKVLSAVSKEGPDGGRHYVHFTMEPRPGATFTSTYAEVVDRLYDENVIARTGEEMGIFTKESSILVLLGMAGDHVMVKGKVVFRNATRMHADRTDATNVCFVFNELLLQHAAAAWMFVHHTFMHIFKAWVTTRYEGKGDAFADKTATTLCLDDMRAFVQHAQATELFNTYALAPVFILYQFHAQVVHVPASYWHCVVNLVPCIKFAWDTIVPERLVTYALTHVNVFTKHVYNELAPDYIGLQPLLVEAATLGAVNGWLSSRGDTMKRRRVEEQ